MTPKNKKSNFKKKITEMKKTAKGKAILKLGGWFVFFIALFIFCGIASIITQNSPAKVNQNNDYEIKNPPENPIKNTNKTKSLSYYLSKLKTSSFSYTYEITSNNKKYIFKGTKESDIETGYKETNEGITKYRIENGYIYEELIDNKILIDNLYENLEVKFLNRSNLLELLNNLTFTNSEPNTFTANDEFNTYLIKTNDNFVESILITSDKYEYKFIFTQSEVS